MSLFNTNSSQQFGSSSSDEYEHKRLRVAILGSSGSIGTQTLDVCLQHRDKIDVVALSVYNSCDALVKAARTCDAQHVVVVDETHKNDAILDNLPATCSCEFGSQALLDIVQRYDIDLVVCAIVGAAGMEVGYHALKCGKTLAYANKESLVVAGDLIMPLVKPGKLIPVDSEHSAIFQCLQGESLRELSDIWLTCSGGPFYAKTRDELGSVTAADALRHPTWKMGSKITIDSATLMNKGLEVLEATRLFELPIDDIHVVIHRQSMIHSMVQFKDGTTKAQLGPSDMRIPIQYALSYPNRWDTPSTKLPDWRTISDLSFAAPDTTTFGCLKLALQAGKTGGTMPCIMNAANEVANKAFREGCCSFLDIERIVAQTMQKCEPAPVESLEQLREVDTQARMCAQTYLS